MFAIRAAALAAALAGTTLAANAQDGGGFMGAVQIAPHRPIQLGASVTDTLSGADPQLLDDTHFSAWRFSGTAGSEVVVRLSSDAFHPFLMLGSVRGGSIELVESAGSGGGNAAELAIALPASGEYVIVANTVNAGEAGPYTLTVQSLEQACAAGGPCSVAGRRAETFGANAPDPIAAAAATARPITLGETREGELTADDPRMTDSSHFQLWSYQGGAGERIVIDHASSDFDAYLIVGLRTADSVRQIFRNDDGPSGLDSHLAVELPEAGTYLIVANTFRANATGSYRLTLRSMEAACAAGGPCAPGGSTPRTSTLAAVATATPRNLALGRPVEARLTGSEPTIRSGSAFHAYRFTARAGDTLALHMTSSDFDSYLYLARVNGSEVEQVAYDDDSGGGRNALITTHLTEPGQYLAVATSFSAGDSGSYVLTVQRLADACASLGACEIGASLTRIAGNRAILAAPTRPIALGQRVTGQITDGMTQLAEGRPFDVWRYSARPGEQVVISQRSSDFDSYLYLYRLSGSGVEEVERDDDSGGDRNAEINTALEAGGDYLILASAFGSSGRGTYELAVQSLAEACAAGGPCAPGETSASVARLQAAAEGSHRALNTAQPVTGRLEESMPTLAERGRYQTYRFAGRAGQRLVFAMNSTDFDPYLYLTQLAGGRLRLIGTDDDGGPGTNARLVATLPETGDYLVIAAAYGSTGVGEYILEMSPCDAACAAAAAVAEASSLLPSDRTFENVLQVERRTLPAAGIVEATLSEDDPAMNDGAHFHAYWFESTEGAQMAAELSAAAFDTYLTLLRLDGDSLVRVAYDDDGGEGTNSRLEWTFERGGTYVLLATSFWSGRTGSYTLRVTFTGPGQRREASLR